jgi:hypothetical protein
MEIEIRSVREKEIIRRKRLTEIEKERWIAKQRER